MKTHSNLLYELIDRKYKIEEKKGLQVPSIEVLPVKIYYDGYILDVEKVEIVLDQENNKWMIMITPEKVEQ